jgi:glycosyltransferase involved in cell wall biosynthesis
MRILMLSQFYSPIIGGEERIVQDLSVELVQRGHEVAVATLWHEGFAEHEIDQGVQIFRIRSTVQRAAWLYRELQRRHAPPWPDPEITWGLRRVVTQVQPEVVHAHNWLIYSFLPLKWQSRSRLVLTLHDYSLVCAKRRLIYQDTVCSGPQFMKCVTCSKEHYGPLKGVPTALGHRVMSGVERAAVDMYLPISHAVANGNGLTGSVLPFQVVPNFVPNHLEVSRSDTAQYTAQLPDEEFILFVGDLSRDKGIHILCDAYATLTDAPPLVLIGRRCQDTPAAFPPNVVVLNSWPHEAVMEAWRRCSIAVVPSVWPEPFGVVVLEAMTCGRPVVASRAGGLAEIVVDGETGLLVPPGDSKALATALWHLLTEHDLRHKMGLAGKHRVEEFRASVIVPRVEEVYRSILAKKVSTEIQEATS